MRQIGCDNLVRLAGALLSGLALTVISLALLAGLSGNAWAGPPDRPLFVPAVTGINPVANTHTAPATTSVSITYDETINPATVYPPAPLPCTPCRPAC